MAAGGPRRPDHLLALSWLLLAGLGLHGVTACDGDGVVTYGKVGGTVEFSPCAGKNLVIAKWKYNDAIIYDLEGNGLDVAHFGNRHQVKREDFSLTVTQLTAQDSGSFAFISGGDEQFPTRNFTLKVLEPITSQPHLSFNISWHPHNQSCTFWWTCSAAGDQSVNYSLRVGNQSSGGSPTFLYIATPSDGDTEANCTVSNAVSETSTWERFACTNESATSQSRRSENFITILSVSIAGCLLLVVLVVIVVILCHCKMSQSVTSKDAEELTVYADIADNSADVPGNAASTPCSLYDTIEDCKRPEQPHTVYDKIQMSRIRNTSVSPYQEVA